MTIQVVTFDALTHTTAVDHEWPNDCDARLARKAAEEWANNYAKQDKSSDHITYVREID